MKAWTLQAPFGIHGLTLVDRTEVPPQHGQVKIAIKAVSLNYRDLSTVKNAGQRSLKDALIPCSDGAGEVIEVGPGVTRVKQGDRVMGNFNQGWISGEITGSPQAQSLGGLIDGVLSETVVLHEDGLVPIPAHLSYVEAATLPCAALTAWNALVTQGKIKSGDVILTQGCGGVSIFAMQFALMHGAAVIATSSSDEKLERVSQLGALGTINYRRTPDWGQQAFQLAGERGVDHVVEVAGAVEQSIQCCRIGGTISIIGALTGPTSDKVAPNMLIPKQLRFQGIYVGSREMFETMNRAISYHQLKPVVDRIFHFDEAQAAFEYMETGSHFGKIVIEV